jgi:hypothetical protein
MKRTNTGTLSLVALSLLTLSAAAFPHVGSAPTQPQRPSSVTAKQPDLMRYGDLPLAFEPNRGQAGARIDFVSRGNGYTTFLTPTELALSFSAPGGGARPAPLRMTLRGADPHARPAGRDRLPGTVNYFRGADRATWRTGVPTYAKVAYAGVYPGVDLVYYGNRRRLEFDFVVAPGADPAAIALDFAGADALRVESGALVLRTAGGTSLRLRAPSVYQVAGGVRHRVAGGYAIDHQRVRFRLARYDRGKPLVIDPTMAYSTRLGGRDEDAAYAIAVDPAGDAYVTGNTNSTDYPVANPAQAKPGGSTDVFVAKLSPDGSRLLYSTYLGGSGSDVGYGIAVDAGGSAYVTGDTRSTDFPLVRPLQARLAGSADIFVAKLSPDGSRLVYSTYVGGGNGERGQGISVDAAGNAYVAGYTNSTDFPTVNALQSQFAGGNADGVVFRVNASGSALDYSTYFGGANDRPDIATAVAADAAGNAYVTGFTNSRDFPVYKPLQLFVGPTDVFAAKFNPKGALVYSTFLGGSADDEAMGIAIDAAGSAYVTGETESPNFPTSRGAFSTKCTPLDAHLPVGPICLGGDAFVTKLSPDGLSIVYSTFVSGNRFEVARAIAVDKTGSAYITGLTNSPDFPSANALQKSYGGGDYDTFVVKLNPAGTALTYSTYLGGGNEDGGYGIGVDAAGNAYVAGVTKSANFPVAHGLPGRSRRGARTSSAFVTKIVDPAAPR